MKVTAVTGQHLVSGIGRYGWELSNQLNKTGILDNLYKPYKENHIDAAYHAYDWVKGYRYKSFKKLHPFILPLFIRNKIKIQKNSILHAHWFISGLAISKYKKNPKVITMHDVSLLHLAEQSKKYIDYYKWAIRRFIKSRIPMIVVSQQAKIDAIKYAQYPEELIHVVYNGINHNQFFYSNNENLRPKNRFRIIYSGGLGIRKNVSLLLKAYKEIESKYNDVELFISGAYPERTTYPALAKALGLKRVKFTGYIDEENMANFYRSGHLMVFPSLYEGFGMAPLESMACGTPVLSAKGGALQETAGNGALIFDYDTGDLISKMQSMIENHRLRETYIQKGIDHASTFSWSKTAAETSEIYRAIY